MKRTSLKKRFLSVEEREAEILERVNPECRGKLKVEMFHWPKILQRERLNNGFF